MSVTTANLVKINSFESIKSTNAKVLIKREAFNPENTEHLQSYESFLKFGKWGGVQFYCEYPYATVPETVSRKFALHELSKRLSVT